jgi:hypothetical protein
MNHELNGEPADSRVSRLRLQGNRVLAGEYVVIGNEGFKRFCSATGSLIDGKPWFFTGEESTSSGGSGRSIAVDGTSNTFTETDHFGRFAHENVVPIHGLPFGLFVSAEDGAADHSQLYAYSAPTLAEAIAGHGQLLVWVPDDKGDGDPSNDDLAKGRTRTGRFVAVSQAENATPDSLEAAAQSRSAFDFTRAEDLVQSPADARTLYFNDTGSPGAQTVNGRTFRLTIDPASTQDDVRAALTPIIDGDHGDDILNPDNVAASKKALILQEDHNANNAGVYGRVLVYDLKKGTLTPVARVDTPAGTPPGEWESSGVVPAKDQLGQDWWLLDVQAHTIQARQPGRDLQPSSSTGESGQLLAVRIPGTQ